MFLNNQQVTEWIKGEIKISRNKWQWKHNIQNLWDAAKAIQGRFIAIQSYLKKQKKHRIDKLSLHLKQLEKEGKKPKISKWKEIIKIRAEIYEKEMKETIVKIN